MFRKLIKRKSHVCLVCGYSDLSRPLYDKEGIPNVKMICSCCGFQPGYDDGELGVTIDEYREHWLKGGAVWFDPKIKPKGWDIKQQLMNINKENI